MTKINRLAAESSPYLLQHAHNPVDWHPWGKEAFAEAVRLQKPVLLSVGYSSCHWCHVMERESFEDPAIASLMNACFVNVKVDREERPDIDSIYMEAVQMLTGQGGWPMTVFLTPSGAPFYAGTYFPPEDRWGRPGFPRVLQAVAEAWRSRHLELEENAEEITRALGDADRLLETAQPLAVDVLQQAEARLMDGMDALYGGLKGAPKFPMVSVLEFLLCAHARTGQELPLQLAEVTLQQMAWGGIYDQIGGGFHRYSTDEYWLVPHFEKMLYDNAQLASVYLHAWQCTKKPIYRRVVEETLEYVLREMTDSTGGFYSAQDADSEGEEGRCYVWTPAEIAEALGGEAADFCAHYDVTEQGNWEGKCILHHFQNAAEPSAKLQNAAHKLLAVRSLRAQPGKDDKVIACWNGLMLSAFAEAGRALENSKFLDAAQRSASFLLQKMTYKDKTGNLRLYRTWRNGKAAGNGFLEDYGAVMGGFLMLYEAVGKVEFLNASHELLQTLKTQFAAPEGGFYLTAEDHEPLLHRPREWYDNAVPGGHSLVQEAIWKLAALQSDTRMEEFAVSMLQQLGTSLARHPQTFGRMLALYEKVMQGTVEIALLGDLQGEEMNSMLRTVWQTFLPARVIAFAEQPAADNMPPLLQRRHAAPGKAAAWVCKKQACSAAVTEAVELQKLLR